MKCVLLVLLALLSLTLAANIPAPVLVEGPPAVEQVETWYHCVDEGQQCTHDQGGEVWYYIRFGAGSEWSFLLATGSTAFNCNTEVFGNPGGSHRSCWVSNTGYKIKDWTQCASEGGVCNVPKWDGKQTYYVKYGVVNSAGPWEYSVAYEGNGPVVCDQKAFGNNNPNSAVSGTRYCYYSPRPRASSGEWVRCSSPGIDCGLPGKNLYLFFILPPFPISPSTHFFFFFFFFSFLFFSFLFFSFLFFSFLF